MAAAEAEDVRLLRIFCVYLWVTGPSRSESSIGDHHHDVFSRLHWQDRDGWILQACVTALVLPPCFMFAKAESAQHGPLEAPAGLRVTLSGEGFRGFAEVAERPLSTGRVNKLLTVTRHRLSTRRRSPCFVAAN